MASTDQPPSPFSFLQYPEMIIQAIEALNDPNGSNKTSIAKYIESTHGELPAAHSTLLSHHLNKMKQNGQLIFVKNNYMKPDPDAESAPPKRGRGRPPKSKDPEAQPGAVLSPARPRGRPPKPKDPLAPAAGPSFKLSSGKPRGRPRREAKPTVAATPANGAARGRGRPPKVKTVAAAPTNGAKRGRGRPPKVKTAVEAIGC